jgi:hypothetical protein
MCILYIFMRALEHLIIFLHLHMFASEHFKLTLRLAFSFSNESTQEKTLVAQAYFFSKFSCLSIKERWECLNFPCSLFRVLSSSILPMKYFSCCSSNNSYSWSLSKRLLILIISFLLSLSKLRLNSSSSSSSLSFFVGFFFFLLLVIKHFPWLAKGRGLVWEVEF